MPPTKKPSKTKKKPSFVEKDTTIARVRKLQKLIEACKTDCEDNNQYILVRADDFLKKYQNKTPSKLMMATMRDDLCMFVEGYSEELEYIYSELLDITDVFIGYIEAHSIVKQRSERLKDILVSPYGNLYKVNSLRPYVRRKVRTTVLNVPL